LLVLVIISGAALAHLSIAGPNGDVIGGWSFTGEQQRIGFTRLMYPFFAGLLLSRVFKPIRFDNAFLWCSLFLLAIFFIPRLGGEERLWLNGLYDAGVIILLFPLIVYLGASGEIKTKTGAAFCKFLGDISYPIYITHFPIAYIFYARVVNNKVPLEEAWPFGLLVVVASIVLAYASLKLYDIPVRKWLTKRFLTRN
jgi:peptidoglycan/LPS O-acetylase OafA/YrhL